MAIIKTGVILKAPVLLWLKIRLWPLFYIVEKTVTGATGSIEDMPVAMDHIIDGTADYKITFDGIAKKNMPPELLKYDKQDLTPDILAKLMKYHGQKGFNINIVLISNVGGGHSLKLGKNIMIDKVVEFGPQGTFRAKIKVFDPVKEKWLMKPDESTFFPLNWSREKIEAEIKSAWRNKKWLRDNKWQGKSDSGLDIEGYLEDGWIETAYPTWE